MARTVVPVNASLHAEAGRTRLSPASGMGPLADGARVVPCSWRTTPLGPHRHNGVTGASRCHSAHQTRALQRSRNAGNAPCHGQFESHPYADHVVRTIVVSAVVSTAVSTFVSLAVGWYTLGLRDRVHAALARRRERRVKHTTINQWTLGNSVSSGGTMFRVVMACAPTECIDVGALAAEMVDEIVHTAFGSLIDPERGRRHSTSTCAISTTTWCHTSVISR